jgi:NADH:ubiquinone reductase (H+-translocating)
MKVVIVGGGFAGVKTALELSKDRSVHVTLVSDRDHFIFYPALYSTATGSSKQLSILSLASLFEGKQVTLILDTVIGIDEDRRLLVGKKHQLHYDRVVFALGVVTSYFGISGLDKYSYSIKSAHEVDRFKRHLHDELSSDRHMDKNYIIVGAGPTGVELAASLATYLKRIADKHHIRHSKIRLSLVEAAPRVLPRMSERASEIVSKRLKQLGVTIMTDKKVESEDDDSIIISGKDVPSKTVVWTSGVANHPFFADHADIFTLAKNGRVEVDEHLKVNKYLYVIGDNANTLYTGLAQTAVHDGHYAAKAIRAEAHHRPLPIYTSKKPPVVIPVGHNWAILEYGTFRLTGGFASFIRRLADYIGYQDVLPKLRALQLTLSEDTFDESCPDCK